jgi:hypothetical protein
MTITIVDEDVNGGPLQGSRSHLPSQHVVVFAKKTLVITIDPVGL